MFRRARQLLWSNYGRDFGWYVELEGRVVGELCDWRFREMFWDDYVMTPASPETARVLFDRSNWIRCRFQFRNRVLPDYALHAFAGGGDEVFYDGRIAMRGLYILPTRWERLAFWVLDPLGRRS